LHLCFGKSIDGLFSEGGRKKKLPLRPRERLRIAPASSLNGTRC
jgi:hypothetical protein